VRTATAGWQRPKMNRAALGDDFMKRSLVTCVVVFVIWAAGVAIAHHSPVLFDRNVTKTLAGTVVEFAWTNPHASIQLDVPTDRGSADRWGVELGSPNSMVRAGWRSTTLKPGDKVTVIVNPLKSGEAGGIFVSITLADGRRLGGRATD
jgi:hypothetical protein